MPLNLRRTLILEKDVIQLVSNDLTEILHLLCNDQGWINHQEEYITIDAYQDRLVIFVQTTLGPFINKEAELSNLIEKLAMTYRRYIFAKYHEGDIVFSNK